MAGLREEKPRNIIPNWRSLNVTARIGEIGSVSCLREELILFPITDYVNAWKENNTVPYASDLVSAAIMNGQVDLPDVKLAAEFIVNNSDYATDSQINTARSVLVSSNVRIEDNKPDSLEDKLKRISVEDSVAKESVRLIRRSLDLYQHNPIAYCELSRNYALLGELKKAELAMDVAVQLNSKSRYISRSAARLYLHVDEFDKAHRVIVNNPWLKKDPWLLASEIAIDSLRGRNSRFIKVGKTILESENYSPFSVSELAGAIGSVELMNGNLKNCKSYFKRGLIRPNDNCLAQANWLVSEIPSINLAFSDYGYLTNKYEADSWMAYYLDQYETALMCSLDWIADMPFTRRPVQFAADMAYTYLKDYDVAIKIIKTGLCSNPGDDTLLNNLAFSHALNGNTEEAEAILSSIKIESTAIRKEAKVCLLATKGLNEYRKGNVEEGKNWYERAIEFAKKNKCNEGLIAKAKLNYYREKVRACPSCLEHLINEIEDLDTGNAKETAQLKKDIKEEADKHKRIES